MKLAHLINHIDNILLPLYAPINKDNSAVTEHLYYIRSLLKKSENNDELNIGRLCEVIHYIETIPIQTQTSMFSKKKYSMSEQLLKNGEVVLPAHERALKSPSLPFNAEVPIKSHEHFGPLHKSLVDLVSDRYQFVTSAKLREQLKMPSIVWPYDYPVEDGEIMNQAIGEWQATKMEPLGAESNPLNAYIDFERNISIRGISGKNSEEITEMLDYLIEGSNYKEHERTLVKQWLQAKGGQDNSRFLDKLMNSGEFTSGAASLLNVKRIEQDWIIENGKAVFFFEAAVYAIFKEGKPYVNDGKGNLKVENNPETINPENKKPLMKVRAKIELNINENNDIVPKLTALNVTSYSKGLVKPEPKTLENTQELK